MKMRNIFMGNTLLNNSKAEIAGEFVEIRGEKYYKIGNYHQMPDFFMTIVSDSDHWMFISSNGSLSAGRKDRDNALFPYYTDDKIHDYRDITGSKTIVRVERENKNYLWEPFSDRYEGVYVIERNLYKSIYGNKLIFEEVNQSLDVKFSYFWGNSEKFGFVKKSEVSNLSDEPVSLEILDGIQNILPNGIDYAFQNEYSNLLDAYKKNELIVESGLGLFMLSSIPVDRAEPSESLNATTVWSDGLKGKHKILLSNMQLESFRKGGPVETEIDVRARRGAYFVNAEFTLGKKEVQKWVIVAEINQDSTAVANLDNFIQTAKNKSELLDTDIAKGTKNLIRIVANADGLQIGADDLACARHFSNTLYNVMRGGIFMNNYAIDTQDFNRFVKQSNSDLVSEIASRLSQFPEEITYRELHDIAANSGNPDFQRICYEYLPLTFSRRHGDPSRPWNRFAIETKNADGSPKSDFQGNWRDIFQNWEALSLSYPDFIEGMISKFVNASTPDGYNPYRIMREGIDWECPDPDDPWAYIGYWGDHQIIYLEKFLELSNAYHPGKLDELLTKEIFVYANVPYRIKSYRDIVRNPQDTIEFDADLNGKINDLVAQIGSDARLLRTSDNQLYRVNLTEKILVTMLSKLSNFIPEAGIWLNTQRPEWNDANNALVGNGTSMVTLYYLRRFLSFWVEKFATIHEDEICISEEVNMLFNRISDVFDENSKFLKIGFSDAHRCRFANELGEAGSKYRNAIYENSFSGKKVCVRKKDLLAFVKQSIAYMDQSIEANKREDGLYHAYNLIAFRGEDLTVRYLYEMLEGQVAVLSSGYLSAVESLRVLDALKASALFRADQYSYILYPDRQLPRFTEKNNIPLEHVKESQLLSKLLVDKQVSIVRQDVTGKCHFNGAFRNASMLGSALDKLDKKAYGQLLKEEKNYLLGVYEEMFDHQSFTGRSGTFYGYEGLGSIYWHMVSKLLLAVQESYFKGLKANAAPGVLGRIADHYYEIKAGIGLSKSPELYGAFPTDAYSHTPGNAGAKQPGMTGQVKEDVISRFGELGIAVQEGKILFGSSLFNPLELIKDPVLFRFFDSVGKEQVFKVETGQLVFTYCQVPVVYSFGETAKVILHKEGRYMEFEGNAIDEINSDSIFKRTGEIKKVEVVLKK